MSTVYNPKPVENTSYTQTQDGDNGDAASIVPWLQGLSDEAAWLKAGGLSAAMNWNLAGSMPHNCKRAVWSPKEQCWYAVGDGGNDFLDRSQDNGKTWASCTAGLGAVRACFAVAVHPTSGNIVIVNNSSRNVYSGAFSSYGFASVGGAFTDNVNALSAVPTTASVDYEATAARFMVVYRVGATGFRAEYDTDGVGVWTNPASLPAGWTGYTGSLDAELTCIPGRAIACFFDDSGATNKYRVIRSTDGGGTWSEVQLTPTTFNPVTTSKPAYNTVRDEWYLAGAATAGGRKTEIWRSTDGGATWTSVANLTSSDMALQDIVCIGDLIVGVNEDGRIHFSADRGVTWKFAGRNPITSAARPFLRKGDGSIIVINSGDKTSFSTLRHGAAGV